MALVFSGWVEEIAKHSKAAELKDFPEIEHVGLIPVRLLGFGGQAVVELVTGPDGILCAARKTYLVQSDKDPQAIHIEACTELRHMVKLSPHRHITTPILAYRQNDQYHIVMTPVADSGSLASFHQKIKLNPAMATRQDHRTLWHCFGCLTMTMQHIHGASIRYKDVKLENILVHQGELLFTDFGVAYDFSLGPNGRSTTEGYPGAQTWVYSAPEVWAGEPRNRKSDMFSLGVVLYNVLSLFELELANLQISGFFCFHIDKMIEKIESIISRDGELIFPIAVYEVVIAMLRRDMFARISSTDALAKLKSHKELFCYCCWMELGGEATQVERECKQEDETKLFDMKC
ncbi:kinase-like domain-containing protein [Paraphoma chrysanthemicola]|nr:kinase-like domain-containing protein [Paraphoma chrysanthemicola]